jgi:hypothetical protein
LGFALAAFCLLACACESPVRDVPPEAITQPWEAGLVGTVWTATDATAPPGALRIFLPDGTLVMDSCFETYRLAAWRVIGDRRIEWREDGATIPAEVASLTPEALHLRLHLVAEVRDEHYRRAATPFICPDMPR